MSKDITYVGLDVHKDTIAVAYARGSGEPTVWGIVPNKPQAVAKVMRRLGSFEQLSCCYEAGPCGYALYRQLRELGIECRVVAPSQIPVKPGDRVKTDRRDARKLASLLRNGDLEPVWVPDVEHEGFRELTRARDAAKRDLQRHRNQATKLLLRLGVTPSFGIKRWGKAYWMWIEAVKRHRSQTWSWTVSSIGAPGRRVVERIEREMSRLSQDPFLRVLPNCRRCEG